MITRELVGATAELTITHDDTGLLLHYRDIPRGIDLRGILLLLVGVGLMALSLIAIYESGLTEGKDAWAVCAFGGLAVYAAYYGRSRLLAGWKIDYQVSVNNGKVTFTHDGAYLALKLAEISRMWLNIISSNLRRTTFTIMAVYGKKHVLVFDAGDLVHQLGGDSNALLEYIVAYLNQQRTDDQQIRIGEVALSPW